MLDCRIDARPDVIGPESQAESKKETPSIGDFDFDMTTLRKHVASLLPTIMTPLPVPFPSPLSLPVNLFRVTRHSKQPILVSLSLLVHCTCTHIVTEGVS